MLGVLIVSVGTGVCMTLGAHNQWLGMPQRIRRFIPRTIGRRYAPSGENRTTRNQSPV
jgi:hypothetical protein